MDLSDEEESDGEADALLESLRKLNAELQSAVSAVDGREVTADAAASGSSGAPAAAAAAAS